MDPNTPPSSQPQQYDPTTYQLNTSTRQFAPIDASPPPGGYVNFLNQGMYNPHGPLPNMFSPSQYNDQFREFQIWQQQQKQQQPQQDQPEQPNKRKVRTKQPAKRRGKQTLQQQQQQLIDEDDDVDFVSETQAPPPPQPTTSRRRGGVSQTTKKTGAWTEDEEETLVKAWIAVSTDATKGNHQTGTSFFGRVVEHFHALLGIPECRTYDACNSKFRELKKEITDFSGAFNKVTNQNKSGANQLDAFTTAQSIFKARNGNKDFCHFKAWRVAREAARWQEQEYSDIRADSSDSNKRARTSESEHSFNIDLNDEAEFETDFSPPPLRRPMGRDAAKRAASGKGVASGSDDPLVGSFKEHVQFAREKAEKKEREKAEKKEEQRKMWELQQDMLKNQQVAFEQQQQMWQQHDLLVQQQKETLIDQQLLANVDILCRVPDQGVDDESRQAVEEIKREIRARRLGRR